MAAKTETPEGRRRDPNADSTSEPWAPKGQQHSPGRRPGPKSPGGTRKDRR